MTFTRRSTLSCALPVALLALLAAAAVEARTPLRPAPSPGAAGGTSDPAVAARTAEGVAVMTGTFDPVHRGHVLTAVAAERQLGVQKVILVPRPAYGDKNPQPLELRLQMLRLAVRGVPGVEVADRRAIDDMARGGDDGLLAGLRRRLGTAPLYRIAGADSFAKALQWGAVAHDLDRGVHCAVVTRAGYPLPPRLPEGVAVVTGPPLKVSSTAIRTALSRGETPPELPPEVARFIEQRGLYRQSGQPRGRGR
jgi:nicotinate-nucleotide adenylyltransferase